MFWPLQPHREIFTAEEQACNLVPFLNQPSTSGQNVSLPRQRSAVNWTRAEQPCLNTEQFSFASSHLLTMACWHVPGICLWWEDHIFWERQEGFLAEARDEWVLPRTDSSAGSISSPEQLREAAEFGPVALPWIQETDLTGSSYPNLPTYRESLTQRTRRNLILTYVKSQNSKKVAF